MFFIKLRNKYILSYAKSSHAHSSAVPCIIFFMRKVLQSFNWAMNGLHAAWREEVNFRIEVILALSVIVGGVYLGFSKLEWVIIIECIVAVLTAELVNTAVEDLCNRVEPNTDPVIGKIKDIMGGFVFVVVLGAGIIGFMVFSNYF